MKTFCLHKQKKRSLSHWLKNACDFGDQQKGKWGRRKDDLQFKDLQKVKKHRLEQKRTFAGLPRNSSLCVRARGIGGERGQKKTPPRHLILMIQGRHTFASPLQRERQSERGKKQDNLSVPGCVNNRNKSCI